MPSNNNEDYTELQTTRNDPRIYAQLQNIGTNTHTVAPSDNACENTIR